MIITKITIKSKEGIKNFIFSPKTIIYSTKNSVGKSSLLRILFYGLGYPIPGTMKIKFKKLEIWVYFKRKNNQYISHRKNDFLELTKNGTIIINQAIYENMNTWFANIWGIELPEILDNLLGAIYMDQDKGWTLLNRGKVIGNIKFNIRDLLIGLSTEHTHIVNLLEEQKRLISLRKEVNSILEIEELANKNTDSTNNIPLKDKTDLDDLDNLKVESSYLKRRISTLKKQLKQNQGLEEYLYSLNLMVKNPNDENNPIYIDKNKHNLLNFDDNTSYIKMQIVSLQMNLNDTEKKIAQINNKINEGVENLFEKQDVVRDTLGAFKKIKVNRKLLENQRDELEKNISDLNNDIDSEFQLNKKIISETEDWIFKFAKILKVEEIVTSNTDYLFTHDLKSLSGTEYYKVVFSFKMAYIKIIEKYTHEKLPIVLDSPSGREVTKRNIKSVISILNKYFKDNQIVIASIHKYNLINAEYIVIKNKLFEGAKTNDNTRLL